VASGELVAQRSYTGALLLDELWTARGLTARDAAELELTLGPDAPLTLEALDALGRAELVLGRLAEAGEHLGRAAAGRERVLGNVHPDTLRTLDALSSALLASGHGPSALNLAERAHTGLSVLEGEDGPAALAASGNLAAALLRTGDPAAAARLYGRLAAALAGPPGDAESVAALSLGNGIRGDRARAAEEGLALSLAELGEAEEALKLLLRLREAFTELGFPAPPRYIAGISAALDATGDHRGALDFAMAAGPDAAWPPPAWVSPEHYDVGVLDPPARHAFLGASHPDVLLERIVRAGLYTEAGRHEEARDMLAPALARAVSAGGPGHPLALMASAGLGQASAGLGDRRTAIFYLKTAAGGAASFRGRLVRLDPRARRIWTAAVGYAHRDLAGALLREGRTGEALDVLDLLKEHELAQFAPGTPAPGAGATAGRRRAPAAAPDLFAGTPEEEARGAFLAAAAAAESAGTRLRAERGTAAAPHVMHDPEWEVPPLGLYGADWDAGPAAEGDGEYISPLDDSQEFLAFVAFCGSLPALLDGKGGGGSGETVSSGPGPGPAGADPGTPLGTSASAASGPAGGDPATPGDSSAPAVSGHAGGDPATTGDTSASAVSGHAGTDHGAAGGAAVSQDASGPARAAAGPRRKAGSRAGASGPAPAAKSPRRKAGARADSSGPSQAGLDARANAVARSGAAGILHAVSARDALHLVLVTPRGAVARETPMGRDELAALAGKFRALLEDPSRDPRPLARKLRDAILGPLDAELAETGDGPLLFSLDGTLRHVPPAALWDGGAWLAERRPTALLVPSALEGRRGSPARGAARLAVLGATSGGEAALVPYVPADVAGRPAYAGTREELSALSAGTDPPGGARHGRRPVPVPVPLLDGDFTRANLLASLSSGAAAAHFAVPFRLYPAGLDATSLMLGDGSEAALAQILAAAGAGRRAPELLTFSLSEDSAGRSVSDGREVEGLGEAASRAGVPAVLASLWRADGPSSASLVREFYRLRYGGRLGRADALREAQTLLIRGAAPDASTPPAAGPPDAAPSPAIPPGGGAPSATIPAQDGAPSAETAGGESPSAEPAGVNAQFAATDNGQAISGKSADGNARTSDSSGENEAPPWDGTGFSHPYYWARLVLLGDWR
jgi:CHAT domain-containing protein/tetratricopeptide (TPR) repeat protein